MNTKRKTFFISTAIPYVNSVPHLGFALEIVQADVLARYNRIKGRDVFFLTGTDENALKNVLAAKEASLGTQELVDKNAAEFKKLKAILNLSWDDFIRTTEFRHTEGVKKFWLACQKDIYRRKYRGLYCVGCEEFKTEKELLGGCCPEHLRTKLEVIEEENYFFRLSTHEDALKELLRLGKLEITPATRRSEILSFIKQGLRDFSVSRSRDRAQGWGIPVPNDDTQILYVWFDALINYITALGYVENSEEFQKYWENGDFILHVIGKGVNRFHSLYWPAMLLSAGIRLPNKIFVHGYLTINGQKISKSLGNVISPSEIVQKYGIDPVRYYLLREIPSCEDGDFSYKKFEDRYNGDLANGLGNLVARVATLGEKISPIRFDFKKDVEGGVRNYCDSVFTKYENLIAQFRLNEALSSVWEIIAFADRYFNDKKPWGVQDKNVLSGIIINASYLVGTVTNLLEPFLPETSQKIRSVISFQDSIVEIKKRGNLFPRVE